MFINSIEVRNHLDYIYVRLSNFIINSSILNTYSRYFKLLSPIYSKL